MKNSEILLVFSTVGSGMTDEFRSALVASEAYIKKAASSTLLASDIERKKLNALIKLNILTVNAGKVRPTFPVFSKSDTLKLDRIGQKYGKMLAEEIISANIDLSWFNWGEKQARLMILGSYILDLEIVDKLTAGKTMLLAREKEKTGNLWMSTHSNRIGRYVFYTFGVLGAKRFALPDVAWKDHLAPNERWGEELEKVRLGERVKPSKLLLDMNYIANGRLAVPFVFKKDKERIQETAKILNPLINQLIKEVNTELGQLSPATYSSKRELLVEAYHWVFGTAVKLMIERNYMNSGGMNYVKWVEKV